MTPCCGTAASLFAAADFPGRFRSLTVGQRRAGHAGADSAHRHGARGYLAAYAGERFAGSRAYVRNYPRELPVLRDLLPGIETPVLIITAARDLVVPPSNAEFLHRRLAPQPPRGHRGRTLHLGGRA